MTPTKPRRPRLRDLGVIIGREPPGPLNAITDVAGVRVGHATLIKGDATDDEGPPVRTGVTAILPNAGDIFHDRLVAGAFVLNGAGEVSGLTQVTEWGLIETPILLTNTLSVGKVSQAAVRHMITRNPGIGGEHDVIIPLVGECDDSFLNNIAGNHIRSRHVHRALDNARSGPVAEGNVGSGTGMVTGDLSGGIGTASRRLADADGGYTMGVLVMSNFGRMEDLRLDGYPVGEEIVSRFAQIGKRKSLYGSIVAVLATDAPLTTHQIQRLCKRVALGIGRVGSYAAHGSGEIVLGFSTANVLPRASETRVIQVSILADRYLDPLYRAVIPCTEEAIWNALCAGRDMVGVNGNIAPALPLDILAEVARRRGAGR